MTTDEATARIDNMDPIEADELAKRVFGPKAFASMTYKDVRIYLSTGVASIRLLAQGDEWSTVFAAALQKAGEQK